MPGRETSIEERTILNIPCCDARRSANRGDRKDSDEDALHLARFLRTDAPEMDRHDTQSTPGQPAPQRSFIKIDERKSGIGRTGRHPTSTSPRRVFIPAVRSAATEELQEPVRLSYSDPETDETVADIVRGPSGSAGYDPPAE